MPSDGLVLTDYLGLGVLWLTGGILIMSMISEWFYSKAIKVERRVNGLYLMPPFRVWCLFDRRDEGYVFILKLPSWAWAYCEEMDYWCWHQRRLMHGPFGWRLYLSPDTLHD